MVKLNRMVLTQGFGFILLPVIAVAVTKFYGDSPEETEKKLERMALEDQLKNSRARASVGKGESDVSVMHDFIRKQAINQQADYSDILRSGRGKVKRQKDMDPPSS
ncbi:Hypothetical protein NocV09_00701130 [Nannochloropsis oceanica]